MTTKPYGVDEIRATIGRMGERMKSKQGVASSAMCRLSLGMSEALLADRDALLARVEEAGLTCAEKNEDILRRVLRRMVGHLETEAEAGDGIHEDAWDDYHMARMLVGQADKGWDGEAAERGMQSLGVWPKPGEVE